MVSRSSLGQQPPEPLIITAALVLQILCVYLHLCQLVLVERVSPLHLGAGHSPPILPWSVCRPGRGPPSVAARSLSDVAPQPSAPEFQCPLLWEGPASKDLMSASSCEGCVESLGLRGVLGEGSRRAGSPAREWGTEICEAAIDGEVEGPPLPRASSVGAAKTA